MATLSGDVWCSRGRRGTAACPVRFCAARRRQAAIDPPLPVVARAYALHHDEYFCPLAGTVDEQFLRRAVPILPARTSAGGGIDHAGPLLGLPPRTGRYAVGVVSRQLRDNARRRAALDAGLDALITRLSTTAGFIDYGRRRDTLRSWSIAPDQWHQLTADLVGRPVSRKSP